MELFKPSAEPRKQCNVSLPHCPAPPIVPQASLHHLHFLLCPASDPQVVLKQSPSLLPVGSEMGVKKTFKLFITFNNRVKYISVNKIWSIFVSLYLISPEFGNYLLSFYLLPSM